MLIGYDRSPAVCCLEHDEQRDLMRHPEKAEYYLKIIKKRTKRREKKKKK